MKPAHALVYFSSYPNAEGHHVWPKTPDDVLKNESSLCVCIPPEVNYERKGEYKETYFCKFPTSEEELCGVVHEVVQQLCADGIEIIYSVHPRSVLLPLYKWYLMRPSDANTVSMKSELEELGRRTYDLCEAFHAPAILTWEERSSFGPRTLYKWLGLASVEDQTVLKELWRKLP